MTNCFFLQTFRPVRATLGKQYEIYDEVDVMRKPFEEQSSIIAEGALVFCRAVRMDVGGERSPSDWSSGRAAPEEMNRPRGRGAKKKVPIKA